MPQSIFLGIFIFFPINFCSISHASCSKFRNKELFEIDFSEKVSKGTEFIKLDFCLKVIIMIESSDRFETICTDEEYIIEIVFEAFSVYLSKNNINFFSLVKMH